MIANDQPNCFPGDVLVRVSARSDGTVLDKAIGVHNGSIVSNRTEFCRNAGIDYGDVVYQRIIYDDKRTYALIAEVDDGSTTKFTSEVVADALCTTAPGVGLFLPVADCVATVLYDPKRRALAIAHLGRHSSYAKLAQKVAAWFINGGSDPSDIIVWMSPHAQKESYRLDWFDRADDPDWAGFYEQKPDGYYLNLAGFNEHLLEMAGIPQANIHVSQIDTSTNPDYFSHMQGEKGGRIGVLAVMRG